jgi:hypothetical protein
MNLCHAYLKETLLPTETSGQVRFVQMYSCTFVRNALIIDKNFLNGIISSQSFKSIQNHVFFEDKRTSAHFDDKEAKRTMSRRERKGELP